MTGQDLLNRMEVFNAELQLQSGEEDVTRALIALNIAQDYFEEVLANTPEVLGDSYGTVTASAATETTTFPTGVLRLDRMSLIDATTSLPTYDLSDLPNPGDQTRTTRWPWNLITASPSPGAPTGFTTKGRTIFWAPVPDTSYTVRWYGLQAQADITAVGTFGYPDSVATPLAAFANRLLKESWDDPTTPIADVARAHFDPVVDGLANRNADGARPFNYRYYHET